MCKLTWWGRATALELFFLATRLHHILLELSASENELAMTPLLCLQTTFVLTQLCFVKKFSKACLCFWKQIDDDVAVVLTNHTHIHFDAVVLVYAFETKLTTKPLSSLRRWCRCRPCTLCLYSCWCRHRPCTVMFIFMLMPSWLRLLGFVLSMLMPVKKCAIFVCEESLWFKFERATSMQKYDWGNYALFSFRTRDSSPTLT